MKYATIIDIQEKKGGPPRWAVATRVENVITHEPLNSRDLDVAITEAKKKLGRGWKVLVPRRGEMPPPGGK